MANRRIASLALAASLGLGLAACASPARPGGTALTSGRANLTTGQGQRHGHCPQGRPLPAGVGEAIDYVDFLFIDGRSYQGIGGPVSASQLGPVIGHIRCSLIASDDFHHGPPPTVNWTAAFLPAGAPVYELRRYPPTCRLAAYLDGRLHVYVAQAHAKGQRTAKLVSCPARSGQ
jgi:hypothetical protein